MSPERVHDAVVFHDEWLAVRKRVPIAAYSDGPEILRSKSFA